MVEHLKGFPSIDVAHLVVDEVLTREPGSYRETDTIGAAIVRSFSGKSPLAYISAAPAAPRGSLMWPRVMGATLRT